VHAVVDAVIPYKRARLAGARADRRGGQLVLAGGAPTRCLPNTVKSFDCGGMADVSPGYGQVELQACCKEMDDGVGDGVGGAWAQVLA
jgi:hypothetical protein